MITFMSTLDVRDRGARASTVTRFRRRGFVARVATLMRGSHGAATRAPRDGSGAPREMLSRMPTANRSTTSDEPP